MKKLYINSAEFILRVMKSYLIQNDLYPIIRIEKDNTGFFIPIYESLSIYYPGYNSKVLYNNLTIVYKQALKQYNKLFQQNKHYQKL